MENNNLNKNKNLKKIKKEISIIELIENYPETIVLLSKYGLNCMNCRFSSYDTLETGLKIHGLENKIDLILKDLNSVVQKTSTIKKDIYDKHNPENLLFKSEPGISEALVRQISKDKKEPAWMLERRIEALKIFNKLPFPNFGPDLSKLNLNEIHFYLKPDSVKNSKNWGNLPEDIRNTYEQLGIIEAEENSLAGVGAQYESEIIYHNLKKELENQGVVFLDCDVGLKKYPELFKKYFMTNCISPNLHKFTALHASFWSGGTFIYIPKGIKVEIPLQAYFRMNAKKGGQFEHTLIIADEGSEVHYIEGCSSPIYSENSLHSGCVEIHVLKNAKVRYSSIENWSKNVYNLNTKRAIVHENAIMEWVNGNFGSHVTMLYPCSVLIGEGAKTDYLGITYASKNQFQDTGCKVYHLAPNTSSNIISKSICRNGGVISYNGFVKIKSGCKGSKSKVVCDGLMMDNKSQAKTFPSMDIQENDVIVSHEASVGKVGEEQLFYLMSRGLSEEEATKMIVSGFIEPIIKELPIEYAVELNRLLEIEMKNSVL